MILAHALGASALAGGVDPLYWLRYGKPVHLCEGARHAVPAKLEGASWGVLASGVLQCRDTGETYVLTVDYMNVFIDPDDHGMLKASMLRFDWLGLALFKAGAGGNDVDWLFDQVHPVKGELRRNSFGRLVFGDLTFTVPKSNADSATNMLLYLTFGGPLVAINVR